MRYSGLNGIQLSGSVEDNILRKAFIRIYFRMAMKLLFRSPTPSGLNGQILYDVHYKNLKHQGANGI